MKEYIEKYHRIDEDGESIGIRGQFVIKGLKLCKHNIGKGCPFCEEQKGDAKG